jgi:iron complex outermembrane receptor protein
VTVDLDVAFKPTDRVTVSLGGNNILNKYPNDVPLALRGATQFTKSNQYSPYGIAGGFYYARIGYAF